MKYKILLLNLGYFSGLDGSVRDYLLKSYRYIFSPKKIKRKITENFWKIISGEKPDIICLLEVRKNQIESLLDEEYAFYDFETKYSAGGLASRIPILKNQCSGFISRKKLNFEKIFIRHGSKKLAYAIKLPGDTRLILFHFALRRETRKKQFSEIAQIAKDYETLVLCGDFNIFKGFSEIDSLIKNLDLNICQKEATIPAFKPKLPIDLFLASKGIKAESKVIRSKLSDHLPVILEIEL